MKNEYLLIQSPGAFSDTDPNVDSIVFAGTKAEMEELFNNALEESEYKANVFLAKVIKKAELTYSIDEYPDPNG